MSEQKKKSRKRRLSPFLIVTTILLQIVGASVVSLMLVVHGPYNMLRINLIGAAMGTYRHQYIAKMLFSQSQIDAVLNATKDVQVDKQDFTKVTPTHYNDAGIEEISISATDGSYSGYLLEIKDPLRVKLALTKNLGRAGENTSDMAADNNAIAAINGGGFFDKSWAGTGSEPSDFVFQDGVVKAVIVPNDEKRNVIALDAKGWLIAGSYSINDLLGRDIKVMSAVTLDGDFKPLVINGKGKFTKQQAVSKWSYAPRTVIGQKQDGTILMLVLDGRRLNMKGASIYDVQKIMLDYGAVTAANLDGGNSSVMYFQGQVINNPSGELGERPVATAFYVESADS